MAAPQFVSADKSITATSASVASKSDLPSSVSPAPVPTTSFVTAPTSGPSTSVSTARSTITSSSSTSVSSTSTATAYKSSFSTSASSKTQNDPSHLFPDSVTDQAKARVYLKKVMISQISRRQAKLFETWGQHTSLY